MTIRMKNEGNYKDWQAKQAAQKARLEAHDEERDRIEKDGRVESLMRQYTVPSSTRCAGTLMDAVKCAVEGEPFYCHEGLARGEEPTRVCASAALLTKAFSSGAKERR